MRWLLTITVLSLLVLCAVAPADAWLYGRSDSVLIQYPNADGDTTAWGESHEADSAFYQEVNETSANDDDYWFWKAKVAGGSSDPDTSLPNADGDIVTWVGSHNPDSADWQHLNEPDNETDYVFTGGTFSQTFVHFDVDTSGSIDSITFTVKIKNDEGASKKVACNLDTSGTDFIFDTITTSTSIVEYITKKVTGLTWINIEALEFGLKPIDGLGGGKNYFWYAVTMNVYKEAASASGQDSAAMCYVGFSPDTTGSGLASYQVDSLNLYVRATHTGDTIDDGATFGIQDTTTGSLLPIEDIISGGLYTAERTGTADSITIFLDFAGANTVEVRYALYDWNDGTPLLLDTTAEFVIDLDAEGGSFEEWVGKPLLNNPTISKSTRYLTCAWASLLDPTYNASINNTSSVGDSILASSVVYGDWPDTLTSLTAFADKSTGYCTFTHTGVRIIIMADTAGTQFAVDTIEFPHERSFLTDSTMIDVSSWTFAQIEALQVGVRELDSAVTDDSLLVSWIYLRQYDSYDNLDWRQFTYPDFAIGQISEGETYDDIWAPNTVREFGSIAGFNTRILFGFQKTSEPYGIDSLLHTATDSIKVDSAFLNLKIDSIVGTPGYIEFRQMLPQGTEGSGFAVQTAPNDDNIVECHSDWDSWYAASEVGTPQCSDTIQWTLLGADSLGWDYMPSAIDTFTAISDTTYRIDITDWIGPLVSIPYGEKGTYNGIMMFLPLAEDSIGTHKVQFFGNQSGPDSTWIDVYYSDSNYTAPSADKGVSDMAIILKDTSLFVVGEIDYGITFSSDGTYGRARYDNLDFGAFGTQHVFTIVDTNFISDSFPTASDWVIDSAKMTIHIWRAKNALSSDLVPVMRGSGTKSTAKQAIYVGYPITQYLAEITSCFSNRFNRVEADRADCTEFSSDILWTQEGMQDSTSSEPDIANFSYIISSDWSSETINTFSGTSFHVTVTEWVDSLQKHSATWGNALRMRTVKDPTKSDGWVKLSNSAPLNASFQSSYLTIWGSQVTPPTAPATVPRNRLRNNKGTDPVAPRNFNRPGTLADRMGEYHEMVVHDDCYHELSCLWSVNHGEWISEGRGVREGGSTRRH